MSSLIQRGGLWYVTWREGDRQRRESLKTKSKVEAKRRKQIWERGRLEERWSDTPADCTVAEFWESYIEWVHDHMARATIEGKRGFWRKFLAELSPTHLSSVSPGDVEALKHKWLEAKLHPTTINNFLRGMKAIYNHALTLPLNGDKPLYSAHNPFVGVKPIPQARKPKKTLNGEQIEKLFKVAVDHSQTAYNRQTPQAADIHLVFALGTYAGLRKKEIIEARWEWIDWGEKTITVRQSEQFTTKTKRDRALPLADKLASILKPHRAEKGYIYRPDHEPEDPKRYRCNFHRSFKYVADKAGLSWVGVHTLRHTFATQLIKAGVDSAKVSQWLGHSSIQVTADVYSHLQGWDDDINRL